MYDLSLPFHSAQPMFHAAHCITFIALINRKQKHFCNNVCNRLHGDTLRARLVHCMQLNLLAGCVQESDVWLDAWLPRPGQLHARLPTEPGSPETQISWVSLGPGPCGRKSTFLGAQLRENGCSNTNKQVTKQRHADPV